MTFEECQKAKEDGTWLIHDDGQIRLGKVQGMRSRPEEPSSHYWDATLRDTKGVEFFSDADDLRVATPNDMLKYGD